MPLNDEVHKLIQTVANPRFTLDRLGGGGAKVRYNTRDKINSIIIH